MRSLPGWVRNPGGETMATAALRFVTICVGLWNVSVSIASRHDQCIGKPDSELTGNASTTLGDCTIHGKLAKWGKKPNGEVGGRVAGNELGSRDH